MKLLAAFLALNPKQDTQGEICYLLDNHIKVNGAKTPNDWGFTRDVTERLGALSNSVALGPPY